ncbi:MAG: hypothetical protein ACTSRU_14175, partial [Candidatus Hodarchaeales archaeon]
MKEKKNIDKLGRCKKCGRMCASHVDLCRKCRKGKKSPYDDNDFELNVFNELFGEKRGEGNMDKNKKMSEVLDEAVKLIREELVWIDDGRGTI